MSKARLQKFLEKLDLELKDSSEEYRKGTANKKYTTFTFRSSTIKKSLKTLLDRSISTEFDGDGASVLKSIQKQLTPLLAGLTRDLRKTFQGLANSSKGTVEFRLIRSGFVVTAIQIDKRDNFRLVQDAYRDRLEEFYSAFLEILQKPYIKRESNSQGEVNVGTAGQAFNLEHMKGKSNVQDFINSSIFNALKEVYNDKKVPEELEKELENFGFTSILTIIKDAEEGTIEIFLGSQILNSVESAKEKQIKQKLQKDLQAALLKLGGLGELKGSDSLSSAYRKKVIKEISKPFKKLKNTKVITEDIKIKESSPVQQKKNVKAKKVNVSGSRPLKKRKLKGEKGASSIPFELLGILNDRLPETLQKNMQSPALNYRTGRFAESVRVIDVLQTNKGYSSFGFTYQKSPYQTFEVGYRQGTLDRDPRKLIDRSIREIAAEYAIGRFFTRRV